jgi:hypothetical protein
VGTILFKTRITYIEHYRIGKLEPIGGSPKEEERLGGSKFSEDRSPSSKVDQ